MKKNYLHLQSIIMEQSRHQFIYGYNGDERKTFLKQTADNYPIIIGEDKPIGIYLDNIGLPKLASPENLDQIALTRFGQEYCDFSIIISIIDRTLRQFDNNILKELSTDLLNYINRIYLRDLSIKISDLQDLRSVLDESRNLYNEEYQKYMTTGMLNNFVSRLKIPFISLNPFIIQYKEMIENEAYIAVIIDHQMPISITSQQAINNWIGSRINANLSIKVACEPDGWESYVSHNGVYIERVHDYGVVDFDDSYDKYRKNLEIKRNL